MKQSWVNDESLINEKYRKLDYKDQLLLKQKHIEDTYSKNGYSIKVNSIIPNPKPKNYRHKVIVSATNIKVGNRFKIRLGLYKEGSKDIIPGVVNLIHDEAINDLLVSIESSLQKFKLEAYTPKYRKGIIKHILVRKSYKENTMMIAIVTQGHILPNNKDLVKEIVKLNPSVKTIVQNIHKIDTPVVMLENNKVLYGKGFIEDEIEGIRFRLSPNSFYQVNPLQMINLYNYALQVADIKKSDFVMDCYSGIGTISLLAAKRAKEVIAIESNPAAVKDATINKKENSISNINFYHNDVSNFMYDYTKEIDVLIMDPARDGADQRFINSVLKLKPKKIVYISCFVETQVRDILRLNDLYKLVSVQPVDMFSYTSHVETVSLLELK
jgi:23S rRNA (uracil1939-C5)-methyltransferase